ncbi:MAG: bifunctional folylpolyglutamate synthase/dihydrofolate synthase [Mariprofundales bacterium]
MVNNSANIQQLIQRLAIPNADKNYHPGHERLLAVLDNLELHTPRIRVRIAGTNGKGSTANFLAAALSALGLKVGLFTSPHVRYINERIRIDDKVISDNELQLILSNMISLASFKALSEFEILTIVALNFFSQQKVDVEILEAGVGARLDTCTAVPATLALLTPVDKDHQAWLGDSKTEIAQEKAWVAKGVIKAISAPQCAEVWQVLKPWDFVQQQQISFGDLRQAGEFQQHNAALSWEAACWITEYLKIQLSSNDIEQGRRAITNCKILGRMQLLKRGKQIICLDSSHNLAGIQVLLPEIAARNFDIIFFFTREDRSDHEMLRALQSLPSVKSNNTKIIHRQHYGDIVTALGIFANRNIAANVFIGGSFVTIGKALEYLENGSEDI